MTAEDHLGTSRRSFLSTQNLNIAARVWRHCKSGSYVHIKVAMSERRRASAGSVLGKTGHLFTKAKTPRTRHRHNTQHQPEDLDSTPSVGAFSSGGSTYAVRKAAAERRLARHR